MTMERPAHLEMGVISDLVEIELPNGTSSANGRRVVQEALPHWYSFTVIAQDPSVHKVKPDDPKKRILTAKVRIPADYHEVGALLITATLVTLAVPLVAVAGVRLLRLRTA